MSRTPCAVSLTITILFLAPTSGRIGLAQNPDSRGIWTSSEELAALAMSGSAWEELKARADEPAGVPNLSNQDDPENVKTLAKALVYARTGVESYRSEVIASCMAAIGTEKLGRTLSLGRELVAYVVAADLVGLPPEKDQVFRAWLREALTEPLEGLTLVSTHEGRPNNWGTHAGASRAAVAAYLGDAEELDRCARVFRGWLGDRTSFAGFSFGDLSWQSDVTRPVAINPPGALIDGHSVDGVLPDDQRRAGGFLWPPPKENYVYEALQGALVQAVILHRDGKDVWNWQDKALLRAFKWLHQEAAFPAEGDDTWLPHLINFYHGAGFPAPVPSQPGKNMGWTDWTHGSPAAIRTALHGRVENGLTGTAVAGAVVQLKSSAGPVYTVRSNVHGYFRFINPPPGTYTLSCSHPGLNWSGGINVVDGQQIFGKRIPQRAGDNVPPAAPRNFRTKK